MQALLFIALDVLSQAAQLHSVQYYTSVCYPYATQWRHCFCATVSDCVNDVITTCEVEEWMLITHEYMASSTKSVCCEDLCCSNAKDVLAHLPRAFREQQLVSLTRRCGLLCCSMALGCKAPFSNCWASCI